MDGSDDDLELEVVTRVARQAKDVKKQNCKQTCAKTKANDDVKDKSVRLYDSWALVLPLVSYIATKHRYVCSFWCLIVWFELWHVKLE